MQNPEAPLPRPPPPPPPPPAQPPQRPQTPTVRALRGPIAAMRSRLETLVTVYFESALEVRKIKVALEVMMFHPELWTQTELSRTRGKLLYVQRRAEAAGTRMAVLQAAICDREFEFSVRMARKGVTLPARRDGVDEVDEDHGGDCGGEGAVGEGQEARVGGAGPVEAGGWMAEGDGAEEEGQDDSESEDGQDHDLLGGRDDLWYVHRG